jgi:hypothetical protein
VSWWSAAREQGKIAKKLLRASDDARAARRRRGANI